LKTFAAAAVWHYLCHHPMGSCLKLSIFPLSIHLDVTNVCVYALYVCLLMPRISRFICRKFVFFSYIIAK
jgi:hypothetical protein